MMFRGRGRPKLGSCKENRSTIRMSDTDTTKLEYIMEKTGKTKTDIFLDALRNYYNLVIYRD